MESSLAGPNYKEEFKGIVERLNNRESDFIIWIYKNYINQTKHDGKS